jgi:hypothetical protein
MTELENKIKEILETSPQVVQGQAWSKTEMDYRVQALTKLVEDSQKEAVQDFASYIWKQYLDGHEKIEVWEVDKHCNAYLSTLSPEQGGSNGTN